MCTIRTQSSGPIKLQNVLSNVSLFDNLILLNGFGINFEFDAMESDNF